MRKYFRWQTLRVLYFKLMRNAGSPEYNARGIGLGLFIGLLVPMGLQLLIVVPLAFLCKASKVLAAGFTFVTNHLTIFVLYPLQCWIGSYLIFRPLTYGDVSARLKSLIDSQDWQSAWRAICELGVELGIAFFAGGLLFASIGGGIGYFVSLFLFRQYQARKAAKRARRQQLTKL